MFDDKRKDDDKAKSEADAQAAQSERTIAVTDASNRQTLYNTPQTSTQVIAAIANYCRRPEQNGNDWKCECPICGRHSLSLTNGHTRPILIRCWNCINVGLNDGYSEQQKIFIDAGLLPPDASAIKRMTAQEREEYEERKRKNIKHWWKQFEPIRQGYAAAKYLQARGLNSFIGVTCLRSAGAMEHRQTEEWRPALIARVYHMHYGLCAFQATYLKWDGSDRERGFGDRGRITFGAQKGGAVWIGRPQPNEEIVIAEGLETLLSAMKLLNLGCGAAALGAWSHMQELVLPSNVRNICVAADNDEAGHGVAKHAPRLWRTKGRKVRVVMPDKAGEDFNDVLLAKGAKS